MNTWAEIYTCHIQCHIQRPVLLLLSSFHPAQMVPTTGCSCEIKGFTMTLAGWAADRHGTCHYSSWHKPQLTYFAHSKVTVPLRSLHLGSTVGGCNRPKGQKNNKLETFLYTTVWRSSHIFSCNFHSAPSKRINSWTLTASLDYNITWSVKVPRVVHSLPPGHW